MTRVFLLLGIGFAAGVTITLQSILVEITVARIAGLVLLVAGAFLLRP